MVKFGSQCVSSMIQCIKYHPDIVGVDNNKMVMTQCPKETELQEHWEENIKSCVCEFKFLVQSIMTIVRHT